MSGIPKKSTFCNYSFREGAIDMSRRTGTYIVPVAFTGFCPGRQRAALVGQPVLGSKQPTRRNLYFLQTDRWYLERRIYLTVGVNISLASALLLWVTPWFAAFTFFVGSAMVWFAATGYCILANLLYWLGAEPRLHPEAMASGRCADCTISPLRLSNPRLTPTHA
jgi:hypothetical protein